MFHKINYSVYTINCVPPTLLPFHKLYSTHARHSVVVVTGFRKSQPIIQHSCETVVTSTLLALLTLLILVARDVIVVELSGVIRKEIHDVSPAHSEAWRRLSSQMTASRHRHAPGMTSALNPRRRGMHVPDTTSKATHSAGVRSAHLQPPRWPRVSWSGRGDDDVVVCTRDTVGDSVQIRRWRAAAWSRPAL